MLGIQCYVKIVRQNFMQIQKISVYTSYQFIKFQVLTTKFKEISHEISRHKIMFVTTNYIMVSSDRCTFFSVALLNILLEFTIYIQYSIKHL